MKVPGQLMEDCWGIGSLDSQDKDLNPPADGERRLRVLRIDNGNRRLIAGEF